MPGGHVDPGETLSTACVREIFEETGIKTEFQGILGFTEFQRRRWGLNDVYFLCLLKPLSFEIDLCQNEIEEAIWYDIDEYLKKDSSNPFFANLKRMIGFVSEAKKNDQFDVTELIKMDDPEKLMMLESVGHKVNLGKRKVEYNLIYPYFLKHYNRKHKL